MQLHHPACDVSTVDGMCTCDARLEENQRISGRSAFRKRECQTETTKEEDDTSTRSVTTGEAKDTTLRERMAVTALGMCMPSVRKEIESYLCKLNLSVSELEATRMMLESWLHSLLDEVFAYLSSPTALLGGDVRPPEESSSTQPRKNF